MWLTAAIDRLRSPVERLQAQAGPALPAAKDSSATFMAKGIAGSHATSAAGGLNGVLAALKLHPPASLATGLDLARSPAQLFAPGSDLAPRMLAAFDPELSTTLYAALGAQSGARSPLEGAQALRVKAAPFGATAPLRPILDTRGVVVGAEEWPLFGATTLGVRRFVGGGDHGGRLELSAEVGDERSSVERDLSPAKGISLRPGTVDVTVGENKLTVSFKGKLPRVAVTITAKGHEFDVVLTDDKGHVWHPKQDEVLRHSVGSHRITVAFGREAGTDGGLVLAVKDEVLSTPAPRNVLPLDGQYDQIVPGSWVVVDWGARREPVISRVVSVETASRTAYGLTAKVTALTLADDWLKDTDRLLSEVRDASVYAQSEPLELAPEPVDDEVAGNTIELGELYERLESGRWVIVEGERTDIPGTTGVTAAEVAMVGGVTQSSDPTLPGDRIHTTLLLVRPLAFTYKRSTVKVWGNVAKATHGESHADALGSGDATRASQQFELPQAPLTFLASANALGAESALEVRVDGVRWHESNTFAFLGPNDQRYVMPTDVRDKTTVVFGDGVRGARLTTGVENVRADYRVGVGRPGNVNATQITQLLSRPLGVAASSTRCRPLAEPTATPSIRRGGTRRSG